jgi:hypothetical protein
VFTSWISCLKNPFVSNWWKTEVISL